MSSHKILSLSAAALCAVFAQSASAQTTATTTPVGFLTVTIPAAPGASQPSLTALSVPLYQTPAFQGAVATVDSSTSFTLSGAAFTAGAYAPAVSGNPPTFLARIKSAANTASVGKFFAITANTSAQVTVDLAGSGVAMIGSALAAGDSVEIVAVNTIGSVFGNSSNPPTLGSGATPDVADNVLLFSGSGWDTYFWNGTIWKRTGNLDRSNVVIYPDDGVFVVHRNTASAPTVTLMGTVPSTAERSIVSGQTFLANRFPTDTTLGGLGLHTIPGWVAGSTPDVADNVLILNTSGGWDVYYWTGAIWKRTGNIDRSSTPIPAGTSVFITHGGADVTLAQSLPYTP